MNCRVTTYTSGHVLTLVVNASREVVTVMVFMIALISPMSFTAIVLVMSLSTSSVMMAPALNPVFVVIHELTVLMVLMSFGVHVMLILSIHVEMGHVLISRESVTVDLTVEMQVMSQ